MADSSDIKIVRRARDALERQGYSKLTMTGLADICGLSRRALYHHFRNKDEVFRAVMRRGNQDAMEAADWAAQAMQAKGGSALDVIATWLDTRFGETRRAIARSAYGEDLNNAAFRVGNDIMIEVSHETQARLAQIIERLIAARLLKLNADVTAAEVAGLVADGARGVNQARPPLPASKIAARYRRIASAILFGCAKAP